MIKNLAGEVLMQCGMPVNIKGFAYITHAMFLLYSGECSNKTTDLYEKIATDFNTKYQRVERAIRHAFSTYIYDNKENPCVIKYFDLCNKRNGAQLSRLYYLLAKEMGEFDA